MKENEKKLDASELEKMEIEAGELNQVSGGAVPQEDFDSAFFSTPKEPDTVFRSTPKE